MTDEANAETMDAGDGDATSFIFNNAIARALRSSIYGTIHSFHAGIKQSVDLAAEDWAQTGAQSPGYFNKTAFLIQTIQKTWKQRVWQHFHPDRDGDPVLYLPNGSPVARSVYFDMLACAPAGVMTRGTGDRRTCRKYAVCPFCRYRMGLRLFKHLEPYLSEARHVGIVAFCEASEQSAAEEWNMAPVNRLLSIACKKKRRWLCDAVVHLPAFPWKQADNERIAWRLTHTIVALGRRPEDFTNPESCTDFTQWKPVPLFIGRGWEVRRATKRTLARMIAQAVRYSPELLYQKLEAGIFTGLLSTPRQSRLSFHGVRRGKELGRPVGKDCEMSSPGSARGAGSGEKDNEETEK